MQALLLRFLETGEIQRVGPTTTRRRSTSGSFPRPIAISSKQTRQREFREDLYYRLNVVHLVIPPLRSHREDIRPLFEYYIDVMAEQHRAPACQIAETRGCFWKRRRGAATSASCGMSPNGWRCGLPAVS
jgi:DNA-binding NtrC family response regulator